MDQYMHTQFEIRIRGNFYAVALKTLCYYIANLG